MLKIENQLRNTINSNKLKCLDKILLTEEVRETYQKVEEEMKQYFQTEKSKDILIQWENKFKQKLKELHNELIEKTEIKLNNIISNREACKTVDERKEQHEMKLFEKSKKLALKLKQRGNDEEEQKVEFDFVWDTWVSEFSKEIDITDVNIRQDMIDILVEIYGAGLVHNCIERRKYRNIHMDSYSDYVVVAAKEPDSTYILPKNEDEAIRDLINGIIIDFKKLIKTKEVSEMGYNTGHIQEIAHLVKKRVKEYKPKKIQFDFKKEFFVDVSLNVCEQAADECEKLHKEFREANDPHIYLERKKTHYYDVFHKFCQGANSAVILGGLICSSLRDPILRSAYNSSATDLAVEMMKTVPLNGNKSNMEKHILKSLVDEEEFGMYIIYLEHPREYFEYFIRNKVKEYMSEAPPGCHPRVLTIIRNKVEELHSLVIKAAETATDKVKANAGDADVWLMSFSDSLPTLLEYNTDHLRGAKSKDVTDFDLVVEFMKAEFTEVTKTGLTSISDVKREMFWKTPDEILIEHLCNCCWEMCPFCYATCNNTVNNHTEKHRVHFHRCSGISGISYMDERQNDTGVLSHALCTTEVASSNSFFSSQLKRIVAYKQYSEGGKAYSQWDITPDLSELPYWKWFVCRFQKDLEKYHNKRFEDIPDDWKRYTKEEAIRSLDEYI